MSLINPVSQISAGLVGQHVFSSVWHMATYISSQSGQPVGQVLSEYLTLSVDNPLDEETLDSVMVIVIAVLTLPNSSEFE
jgi:hypothetical protein